MRRLRSTWLGAGIAAGAFVLFFFARPRDGHGSNGKAPARPGAAPSGPVIRGGIGTGAIARRAAADPATGTAITPADAGSSAAVMDEFWEELRNLRQRAADDPEGALAAAAGLPEGAERTQAVTAVCLGAAEADPEDGLEIARAVDPGSALGAVGESIVQQWAATDPGAALAWTERLPAGPERDACVARVIAGESPVDPAAAAELAVQALPPGSVRRDAVFAVAHDWAARDPVAAAGWINRFPAGSLRDGLLAELERAKGAEAAMSARSE